MVWSDYLKATAPAAQQRDIAQAAGVDQATVSRWQRSGVPPRPENVAAFARAYRRPVLEAFVAAGFLSNDEAKERPRGRPRLDLIEDAELLAELGRRLGARPAAAAAPDAAAQSRLGLAARTAEPLIGAADLPHEP
ncbi:MAG: helix-turn-helix transcriptional regulator [Renibacterium sp.]|nr:helix-turn-helix transcriptional regulator [Renibacterium sp.]